LPGGVDHLTEDLVDHAIEMIAKMRTIMAHQ
jgi:hypothetical protein